MTIEKLPSGTRGARTPPAVLWRLVAPVMLRMHRRAGDRFRGNEVLYLTTIGARSGQERTTAVASFDDGGGGRLVVASAGGSARHPGWYHNIAAHPDQVLAEIAGARRRVTVEQLEGEERDRAWSHIIARAPDFDAYTRKTDRPLPVLRLTPVPV